MQFVIRNYIIFSFLSAKIERKQRKIDVGAANY